MSASTTPDMLGMAGGHGASGRSSVQQAYAECERLARQHYENFPVASLLMPKEVRPHVAAIYAFARIADDFADEARYEGQDRLALLEDWHQRLLRCTEREDDHPAFIALGETIRSHRLPLHPFEHLLTAFRLDVVKGSYATFEDLLGYCRYSANPVGQLVLLLNEHHDPRMHMMSDDICTALQLTNFWQDVAVDHAKGRCYLPVDELDRFGVDVAAVVAGGVTPAFRSLMKFQVGRTREIFRRGAGLPDMLAGRLGLEIGLTIRGGMKILDKIEEIGFDVIGRRPKLGAGDWIRIVAGSVAGAAVPAATGTGPDPAGSHAVPDPGRGGRREAPASGASGSRAGSSSSPPSHRVDPAGKPGGGEPGASSMDRSGLPSSTPAQATAGNQASHLDTTDRGVVHDITTRSRSNFYYAFFFLPKQQREAIESLYAFCRGVDDAVDDNPDPAVARAALDRWRRELAACYGEGSPSDPVTRDLIRHVRSFGLSREPLEEVIRGVEMDLDGSRYETWEELQLYCRRVASAVGLSCIEIFGSRGEPSRRYATTLGLAFQLTNILRDIRQDARRGRLYLPAEEMRRFGFTMEDAAAGKAGRPFADLMAFQCARARELFDRARAGLPRGEEDRLLAAEIMRTIYAGILEKIDSRPGAVLEGRVALSTGRRIAMAAAAYAKRKWAS